MKNTLIDKQIHKFNQINRKINLDIRYTAACVAATAFLALPLVSFIGQSDWLNSICVAIGWCGAAGLFCILLYLLIGDSRTLHRKETGSRLERCEVYFDANDLNTVAGKLQTGDFNALLSIPRSFSPDYTLVVYRSDDNGLALAQLIDNSGLSKRALTDIKIYTKGEFNIPDEAESLTRFFY